MAKVKQNRCSLCGQFTGYTRSSELDHMCRPPKAELIDLTSKIGALYRQHKVKKWMKQEEELLMWGKNFKRRIYGKNSYKIHRQQSVSG